MMLAVSIACGAIIGALSRYYLLLALAYYLESPFPWHTLILNSTGSFLMGLLLARLAPTLSPDMTTALTVGVLGSFTTFSAVSLDAVRLIQAGNLLLAILYSLTSLGAGIVALLLGYYLTTSVGSM